MEDLFSRILIGRGKKCKRKSGSRTSPERRILLEYFFGRKASDELTRAIDDQVLFTQNLREWRKEHMTLEQEIQLQARYAYDDGFSQGVSQGLIQGKEQGAHDAKVETAKILYGKGMSVEEISEITKLDADEISQIVKS